MIDTPVAFYSAGNLSYFEDTITIKDAISLFTSPDTKEKTEYIREKYKNELAVNFNGFEKGQYQKDKRDTLDSIVFGGAIDRSSGKGKYSGFLTFDLDDSDKVLLTKFYNNPPPFCLLHAWSVSGAPNGFAVFTSAAENEKQFKLISRGIKAYLALEYGLTNIMMADSKRIRYISYDEDIYVNWKCTKVTTEQALEWSEEYYTRESTQSKIADEINTNDWVDFCTQYAVGHGYEFKSGQKHMFRTYFAIGANLLGVPLQQCINYVHDNFGNNRRDLSNAVSFPYHSYKESHKKWGWRLKSAPKSEFTLDRDQYISDLNMDFSGKVLFADTGTGKTRYAVEKLSDKLIIAVPYYALCMNISAEYGIESFSGRSKCEGEPDKIVTTYASLPTLVRKIGKNIKDYHLVIDEAHNLTISATRGFMLDDLNFMINCIERKRFKEFTLLSGTWLYNVHPILSDLEVIRVRKPRLRKIINYVRAEHTLQATIDIINQSIEQKHFPFVLQNDTSVKRNTLVGSLAPLKVKSFTSRSKQDVDFINIVQDSMILPGIDCVITTTVLKEGNNINNQIHVNIIVVGNYHHSEIEQVSQRFRKAKSITIYLIKAKDGVKTNQWADCRQFTWDRYQKAKQELKAVKSLSKLEASFRKLIDMLPFRFNVDDHPVLDYLLISHYGIEQEKIVENRNLQLMLRNLEEYNIEFGQHIKLSGKLEVTKEVAEMLNNNKKQKESNYQNRLMALSINPRALMQAKDMERFGSHKMEPGEDIAVNYFIRLCKYNEPKTVLEYMKNMEPIKNRLTKLERYFLFNAAYHVSLINDRPEKAFLDDIINYGPNHLTIPELADFIIYTADKHGIGTSKIETELIKWDTGKGTLSSTFIATRNFLDSVFQVETNRVRIDGKRVTQVSLTPREKIPVKGQLNFDKVMDDYFTGL